MLGKCASTCCSLNGLLIFLGIVALFYARTMQGVATLTPLFSEQQFAEMWWWTKFLFLSGDGALTPPPLPLSVLKHRHSDLELVEYWVHNDSEAVSKFLATAGKLESDSKIVILRGVWANNTETKFRGMDSVEKFMPLLDLDQTYETTISEKHKYKSYQTKNFSDVLENLPNTEDLWGLTFDFKFLESQKKFFEEYKKVYRDLDPRLEQQIMGDSLTSHTFLYHGTNWVSNLHAAPVADYFIQIANKKKWRFIHKAYNPYVGIVKQTVPGISFLLSTPVYFSEDYPEPGIPYTEFTLNEGDLLWFGPWHLHQVRNVIPDQLGLAVGIRPNLRGFHDEFIPMKMYNLVNVFSFLKRKFMICMPGYMYAEAEKEADDGCSSKYSMHYTIAWNGERMMRYDFKRNPDGTCEYLPRQPGYQAKEISKEWTIFDWKPAKDFLSSI